MTLVISAADGAVVDLSKVSPVRFLPGDVVRLKSGGPKMTVLQCTRIGVDVCWFDRDGFNKTQVGIDAIQKVSEKPHVAPKQV